MQSGWRFEYLGGRCGPPPLVPNAVARLSQTSRSVTVTCLAGHRFPGGITVKTYYCHADGTWENIPHCDGQYTVRSNNKRNISVKSKEDYKITRLHIIACTKFDRQELTKG